jgi:hypothetical protein
MIPVRTVVIQDLCTAIRTIPEIKFVDRTKARPVDLALVSTPACFIYDILPEQRSRNGLWMESTLEIAFVVFVPLTSADTSTGQADFHETADILSARIHSALLTQIPVTSRKVITDIEEVAIERELPNEQYGELTYTCMVKYRHARGNGFTTEISC